MEEDQEKSQNVVINSNILFSSLIKEEGFTRAVLLFLKDNKNLRFLIPQTVVNEFRFHVGEITRKSKLSMKDVITSFEKLLENVEKINELELTEKIKEGMNYVKDENDTPFVAIALKYKPSYIMTYNKKDYKTEKLKKLDIIVVTPKEALDLIGIEKLKVESKEKRKKNIFTYFTKLKMLKKR
jgi:putative PIN family toxin of toxin-antitoxin system